jgi:hypothetical protein
MRCDRLRTAQFAGAIAVAATAAFAAACGGSNNTSTVTAPTGTVVTQTFSGTIQPGGASNDAFTVTVAGTVSITLVAAGPPPTIQMVLGVGNPSATGTCAFIQNGTTQTSAGSAAQLSGTLAAGSYCVSVVDVGNALGPIAYTVTVAHT